jgi:hypothetical protein
MANALKEGNDHHQGKHMRKRRQPSPFIVDEKKEMTITEVNTLKKRTSIKTIDKKKGNGYHSLPCHTTCIIDNNVEEGNNL